MKIFNIPGWKNSREGHWQTIWEADDPQLFQRIEQENWNSPTKSEWVPRIAKEIQRCSKRVFITAHSIGVMAFVHAVKEYDLQVKGALLVAPSDPKQENYPKEIIGFAPVPLIRFPFPSIVVASDNDRPVSLNKAQLFAKQWGSKFHLFKSAGHIDPKDGFGSWPAGRDLLSKLIAY